MLASLFMRNLAAVAAVIRDYPRIFFACHRRHTRDPASGDLVSERQVQILDHLDEMNAMSLTALAEHMGVTAGTMSIAIERLVRRGFVARTPDEVDRRRVLLRLTAAGARVCDAHSVLDPDLVDALVEAVPANDRERALEGLALLARAAGATSHERPAHSIDHTA
jgi:DNA-binding MarR family transcriptional regulator